MFQKNLNYIDLNLKWNKSDNPEYPFQVQYHKQMLQIRVNDFPEEQMYSLIVDNKAVLDFDDWPQNWVK